MKSLLLAIYWVLSAGVTISLAPGIWQKHGGYSGPSMGPGLGFIYLAAIAGAALLVALVIGFVLHVKYDSRLHWLSWVVGPAVFWSLFFVGEAVFGLLNRALDPQYQYESKATSLIKSIDSMSVEDLKRNRGQFESLELTVKEKTGRFYVDTPLARAITLDKREAYRKLLEAGYDLENKNSEIPLTRTAFENGRLEILEDLLQRGQKIAVVPRLLPALIDRVPEFSRFLASTDLVSDDFRYGWLTRLVDHGLLADARAFADTQDGVDWPSSWTHLTVLHSLFGLTPDSGPPMAERIVFFFDYFVGRGGSLKTTDPHEKHDKTALQLVLGFCTDTRPDSEIGKQTLAWVAVLLKHGASLDEIEKGTSEERTYRKLTNGGPEGREATP